MIGPTYQNPSTGRLLIADGLLAFLREL